MKARFHEPIPGKKPPGAALGKSHLAITTLLFARWYEVRISFLRKDYLEVGILKELFGEKTFASRFSDAKEVLKALTVSIDTRSHPSRVGVDFSSAHENFDSLVILDAQNTVDKAILRRAYEAYSNHFCPGNLEEVVGKADAIRVARIVRSARHGLWFCFLKIATKLATLESLSKRLKIFERSQDLSRSSLLHLAGEELALSNALLTDLSTLSIAPGFPGESLTPDESLTRVRELIRAGNYSVASETLHHLEPLLQGGAPQLHYLFHKYKGNLFFENGQFDLAANEYSRCEEIAAQDDDAVSCAAAILLQSSTWLIAAEKESIRANFETGKKILELVKTLHNRLPSVDTGRENAMDLAVQHLEVVYIGLKLGLPAPGDDEMHERLQVVLASIAGIPPESPLEIHYRVASTYNNLGNYHYGLGSWKRAELFYLLGYKRLRRLGMPLPITKSAANIACTSTRQKFARRSRRYAAKAIEGFAALKQTSDIKEYVLVVLGEELNAIDEPELAKRLVDLSALTASQLPTSTLVAAVDEILVEAFSR